MISNTFTICFLTALSTVAALGPAAVKLGTAINYAILTKSGVTTVPPSVITGAIGVSPISDTGLSGFSQAIDPATRQFSTSAQVTGKIYTACYAAPTPATLTTAIGDMAIAYADAAGRLNPNFTNFATGAIGGLILTPGLYKWTTAVTIGNDITIVGAATDTWIFQVAGTLSVAAGKKMVLAGGAASKNIVWAVAGAVSVAAGGHTEGVILGKTSITYGTGATANSRLFAQTAVSLAKATVTN
ncbi:antifreeze protein [Mycena polygramma]|nr:antifreeze protein [Mycena polygramma]